jgi:hypothetical protein
LKKISASKGKRSVLSFTLVLVRRIIWWIDGWRDGMDSWTRSTSDAESRIKRIARIKNPDSENTPTQNQPSLSWNSTDGLTKIRHCYKQFHQFIISTSVHLLDTRYNHGRLSRFSSRLVKWVDARISTFR